MEKSFKKLKEIDESSFDELKGGNTSKPEEFAYRELLRLKLLEQ